MSFSALHTAAGARGFALKKRCSNNNTTSDLMDFLALTLCGDCVPSQATRKPVVCENDASCHQALLGMDGLEGYLRGGARHCLAPFREQQDVANDALCIPADAVDGSMTSSRRSTRSPSYLNSLHCSSTPRQALPRRGHGSAQNQSVAGGTRCMSMHRSGLLLSCQVRAYWWRPQLPPPRTFPALFPTMAFHPHWPEAVV